MSTLKVTNLQNENGTSPAITISVGGTVTVSELTSESSTYTGIVTAQSGINVTGGGIVVDTGISTFSGGISGTTATFTGNVSIGGTLTYEDVTNVDSVGLVTARQGIRLGTDVDGVSLTGNNTGVGINSTAPKTDIDISQQTGAVALPQGTTSERPSGSAPYIRYNTTNSALEFYNGTNWVEIITDYFPTGSTTLG